MGLVPFVFGLPLLSGHPEASGAAPKDKVCIFGGTAEALAGPTGWRGSRNPEGRRMPEAEDRSSAGRG
jgi:hypothetical protein